MAYQYDSYGMAREYIPKHRAERRIYDLLFGAAPTPETHQARCFVCGRSRQVTRTDFWPYPSHPKIWRFGGQNKFRKITSAARALPDFVIIGAPKSGTTHMYGSLGAHPHVIPALRKEIDYFSDMRVRRFGTLWYRSYFPSVPHMYYLSKKYGARMVCGEASTSYLFHPLAPKYMREALPDVKLLVMLRNPVDRAYSDYNMWLRYGMEGLRFEDAVRLEQERVSEDREKVMSDPGHRWFGFYRFSYLGKGVYADQLENWFRYYDRSRFLITTTEMMKTDPQKSLNDAFGFLGLAPFQADVSKKLNVGSYKKMNSKTRDELLDYFRPHNERLYRLLGRSFDWDG